MKVKRSGTELYYHVVPQLISNFALAKMFTMPNVLLDRLPYHHAQIGHKGEYDHRAAFLYSNNWTYEDSSRMIYHMK